MGTYGLKGVMTMWEAGKLTNEQAIGQILQMLEIIEQRLNELERRQRAQWEQRARQTSGASQQSLSVEQGSANGAPGAY